MRDRLRPWWPLIWWAVWSATLLGLILAAVIGVRWAPNALIGLGFVMLINSLAPGWWKPIPSPKVQRAELDALLARMRQSELDEEV